MIMSIDIDENDEESFKISETIEVISHNGNAFIMTDEDTFALFSVNQFLKSEDIGYTYTEGESTLIVTDEQYDMIKVLFEQGKVKEK